MSALKRTKFPPKWWFCLECTELVGESKFDAGEHVLTFGKEHRVYEFVVINPAKWKTWLASGRQAKQKKGRVIIKQYTTQTAIARRFMEAIIREPVRKYADGERAGLLVSEALGELWGDGSSTTLEELGTFVAGYMEPYTLTKVLLTNRHSLANWTDANLVGSTVLTPGILHRDPPKPDGDQSSESAYTP